MNNVQTEFKTLNFRRHESTINKTICIILKFIVCLVKLDNLSNKFERFKVRSGLWFFVINTILEKPKLNAQIKK